VTGGVTHDLLRHATDVDASTTQRAVVRNGDRGSVFCCATRMRDTATAGTDNKKIVFLAQSFLHLLKSAR